MNTKIKFFMINSVALLGDLLQLTEELLVEEISIDGMCGVY